MTETLSPSHFRVGNLANTTDGIQKVIGVYASGLKFANGNDVERFGKTLLIPLTPEILQKTGFEKQEEGAEIYWKAKTGKYFPRLKQFSNGFAIAWDEDMNIEASIDYLHHLQNLYFDVTGEELEIEL